MSQQENESIRISVKDFMMRYMRYLPLFVISVSIALILSYVYLRYTTPFFTARASMLIKTDKASARQGGEEFDEVFFTGGRGNTNSEIEILKSLNLSKRVAASLGLQKKYYAKGNIKTTINYPVGPVALNIIHLTDSSRPISFEINILNDREFKFSNSDKKYVFGEHFQRGQDTFAIVKNDSLFSFLQYKDQILTWEPLDNAGFFVQSGLQVTPIKDPSNVLSLTYLSTHPMLAKDILNQLMIEYRNLNIEDKNQTASRTISFINERLNLITQELGDVEKDLQQYKQKNKVANLQVQSQLYISSQSEVDQDISKLEIKQSVIGYLLDYLSDDRNRHTTVPTTLGIDEPVLVQQIGIYNDLQLKRETLLKTTTENNLLVKGMETQAEKLAGDIVETLKSLKETNQIQIDKLKQRNQQFNSNIGSVPIREKELLEITRQQGIKQSLYLFLLQKREETAISLAATVSNSQVVDAAIGSDVPVKPNPGNVKMLAVFLGLVIPIGIIYVRELLNDKISSRPDITKITDAPIFGEIGHSEDKGVLLVRNNKRDVVTEQFRMIRTNIQYMVGSAKHSVILVTSTFSGEGKSFISVNTGAVMALAGKKTVVLEMDIRKPKIAKNLNLPRAKGISNFLVGNIAVESLVVPVPGVDNLYVIPCGPIPPNPSEMLLNEKLLELFNYVKETFDIVIIDTAPVGLVSDAFTLSQFAASTLYIVRMGYTLKKQMHFIEELYRNNKLPRIGLLVNDIKTSSHYYSYGNYGGYGYGYGYGHGHSNGYYESSSNGNHKVKNFFRKMLKS